GQGSAQIDGGGGLADATFLIGDGKHAKRGGAGKHASHKLGSFLFGSNLLTRTMCATASVRLGISSSSKVPLLRAAWSSVAASRPFRNKPTVREENQGAARPSSLSRGARARAVTTSAGCNLL